jgi:hypothetical protein
MINIETIDQPEQEKTFEMLRAEKTAEAVGYALDKVKERFEETPDQETADVPENFREAVKKLFDKFDDSLFGARNQLMRREGMTLEKLLGDFGYTENQENTESQSV